MENTDEEVDDRGGNRAADGICRCRDGSNQRPAEPDSAAAARQTGMYAPSPYDVNQFGGN
jgi:hypothetical protein